MDYFIFFTLEIFFFFIIKNYFTIIFFHHFSNKIKISIKAKSRPPYIKDKEINNIIKVLNFDYVGIRKESIFKIFSLKYFLYKNNQNNYLDITKNKKFYYISFYLKNKLHLLYKKNLQISALESDTIKISFLTKGVYNIETGEDVTRESIAQYYYKNNATLMSLSLRIPIYLLILGYFIQFFYIIVKWLI